MTAFLFRQATSRHVLVTFGTVAVLWLLSNLLLVPGYREAAAGFVPLDLQNPLTREMVAFQRGAFGPGVAPAYLRYASLDVMIAMGKAVFITLFWCWLAVRTPNTFAGPFLRRGGYLLPWAAAVADIAENVCFMQLMISDSHDPQHAFTAATLVVHRTMYLLSLTTNAITVGLVSLAAFSALMRRPRNT